MSNALILEPGGNGGCKPVPNPWKPTAKGQVKIDNQSGFEQKLTNITKGALNPSPHDEITIAKDDNWKGTVGPKKAPPILMSTMMDYQLPDREPVRLTRPRK